MTNFKTLVFCLVLVIIFGCTNQSENRNILEVNEFVKQYESDNSAILLDVRTEEEFNNGFIEGALNFDVTKNDFTDNIKHIDKEKTIFVYCKSGNRSNKAVNIFKELGYKKVYDLEDGYIAYKRNN